MLYPFVQLFDTKFVLTSFKLFDTKIFLNGLKSAKSTNIRNPLSLKFYGSLGNCFFDPFSDFQSPKTVFRQRPRPFFPLFSSLSLSPSRWRATPAIPSLHTTWLSRSSLLSSISTFPWQSCFSSTPVYSPKSSNDLKTWI